jgi:hypothetical protein
MSITYKPIVRSKNAHYSGTALVGTYSVIIGWNMDNPALRNGLHGFAIRRTELDPNTNEILRLKWLGGYKRFAETDEGQSGDVSSLEAPFQRFRWNDYSLKASRVYIYEVFPMRGTPTKLIREETPLRFEVCPSPEDMDNLGIYVNRGVTAAAAYLSRFKNQSPKEIGLPAYRWLSRGLKESLLEFIHATKSGEALHIAIYEFFDHEVAQAFKDAVDRNVKVTIVHDAKPGKRSTKESTAVLHEFGLTNYSIKRTTVNISHNKIVIRLVNNKPKVVWTGSANFSENAFNFQSNTALIIRDKNTVKHYEDFFQGMLTNPSKKDSKINNLAIMDKANSIDNRFAEKTFFSPIKKKDILETSCELINSAKSIVMISAPFGLDKTMLQALHDNDDRIIEYGLVNSTAKKKIDKLHRKNTRFFTPKRLKTYMGKSWDAKAFGAHKIHAKTIVVDPWSDNPKVFIGSANFSKASCSDNDENALLIVGNKRLASIIATEFMRMYDHYKSRYYIDGFNTKNKKIKKENKQRKLDGLEPLPLNKMDIHLKSDEKWSKTTFDSRSPSHKYQDRIVFSGE